MSLESVRLRMPINRQIDQLKAKVAKGESQRDALPKDSPRRAQITSKLNIWEREIARCWRKYEARNKDLAHLAANVLLVLATASGCSLIAGESLKSLKSTGRGRGAKGKWRNWRNNAQIRGELWRCLRYKCHLAGIHLEWQQPRKTSHTCLIVANLPILIARPAIWTRWKIGAPSSSVRTRSVAGMAHEITLPLSILPALGWLSFDTFKPPEAGIILPLLTKL